MNPWQTGDLAGASWTGHDTVALLAVVLGCRRSEAQRWLSAAGSLRALPRLAAHPQQLPAAQRQRLLATLELARRSLLEGRSSLTLREASAIAAWFRDLALAEVEVLGVVGLDAGGRVLVEQRIAGSVDSVHASPRDILRPVIAAGAVALAVAHNHPSGQHQPSAADLQFTAQLQTSARLCGLRLTDHVILGGGRWLSLRALGHVADEVLP